MILDAVILACKADRDQAARLTEALGAAGLRVKLVAAGDGTEEPVTIPDAPCRVLAITRSSPCADWLAASAATITSDGKAIAVRLERGAEPPADLPTYDYLGRGFASQLIGEACLTDIVSAIRAIQQDTFPPSPTARWRMYLGRLWVYLLALGAIIGVVGYFMPWDRVLQSLDFEEQADWDRLQQADADCKAFDAFLDAHPSGRYAPRVRDALANPDIEARYVEDATRLAVSGPLFSGKGYATRSEAVKAAQLWAEDDAQKQCENLSERLSGRGFGVKIGALNEQCIETNGRWLCTVDGDAVCRIDMPVEEEVCRLRASAAPAE